MQELSYYPHEFIIKIHHLTLVLRGKIISNATEFIDTLLVEVFSENLFMLLNYYEYSHGCALLISLFVRL